QPRRPGADRDGARSRGLALQLRHPRARGAPVADRPGPRPYPSRPHARRIHRPRRDRSVGVRRDRGALARAGPTLARMGEFAAHLHAPVARGHAPAGAATGAAGGAACGDLVRVSVTVAGERVADAGFDAAGCGATLAAGSAAVALVRGRALLDALRVGPDDIAAELGGLSPGKRHAAELAADALARALGASVRADGRLAPVPGRVLVAMSGGVDSAVAALLETRAGSDVAAVTLELWADPANDGERSCCSAQAVRGARALAHRMGIPHLTLDLREEFRAGVVEPFLDDHAAGLTPNPCVRCNGHVRLDAMLAFADRVGAAHLATGHYARIDAAGRLRAGA